MQYVKPCIHAYAGQDMNAASIAPLVAANKAHAQAADAEKALADTSNTSKKTQTRASLPNHAPSNFTFLHSSCDKIASM